MTNEQQLQQLVEKANTARKKARRFANSKNNPWAAEVRKTSQAVTNFMKKHYPEDVFNHLGPDVEPFDIANEPRDMTPLEVVDNE